MLISVLDRAHLRLDSAIEGALHFLQRHQAGHGEISARRYFDPQLTGDGMLDSSPFATTFALHALAFCARHPLAAGIRHGAISFLLEEREGPGLWRYWASRAQLPIDPDLDDTCCASFALVGALRASGQSGAVFANRDLILANRNAQGQFKTWFRPADQANDIDAVVNVNVLLYLGDRAETAAASAAVVQLIEQQREGDSSHYYLDPYTLYYAIARAYDSGGVRSLDACRLPVLQRITTRHARDGGWGDAMTTALALCTLASFGASYLPAFQAGLRQLLDAQHSDGGFVRAAFYGGPEPPAPRSVFWGSEELTTSLCLEAFGRAR